MGIERFGCVMLTTRLKLIAVLAFCVVYAVGCHHDGGLAPLPPGDGPLTGTWIQPSVDTWVQLELSQSGSRVVGYYQGGSANFGGSLSKPIAVTGTAALPQVTLQWTDNGTHWTMDATLSTDGSTLTGTWSSAGQPAQSFRSFHRSPNTATSR